MEYELSLSPDYVSSWTLVDAVRELFQNAIDQEVSQPGNTATFHYSPEDMTLTLSNKLSVLSTRSLLLGSSTKAADKDTIGQFGEGYKVASLVLTRLNKSVIFWNKFALEIWTPRITYSDKYDSNILVFDVRKRYFPDEEIEASSLVVTVSGITENEYQTIVDSNLHLQSNYSKIETAMGDILLDERHAGKVFVNGLFVCNYTAYAKGYNFKPRYLKLDRDRKLADSFELEWLASSMWSASAGGNEEIVSQLILNNAVDVRFYTAHKPSSSSINAKVSDISVARFFKEHGSNAIPVVNQNDMNTVPKNRKPVIVTETARQVLMESEALKKVARLEVKKKDKLELLDLWYERNKRHLPLKEKRNFGKIRREFDQ